MKFFKRNKEKEYATEFEELNIKLDIITSNYNNLNRELMIVKQQNKDLKQYINQLADLLTPIKQEKMPLKKETDKNVFKLFLKKYRKENDSHKKEYTNKSIGFDGFNYKIIYGRASGQILTDVITMNNIYINLPIIVKDSLDNINSVAKEFNIPAPAFKKIVITLIKTPKIFTKNVDYYYGQNHNFQFKDKEMFIDDNATGLKKIDVEEIKAYMENSSNNIETISKLVNYYSNVDNKYIVLSALNYTKLPVFSKKDFEVIEGRSKRKEAGLI